MSDVDVDMDDDPIELRGMEATMRSPARGGGGRRGAAPPPVFSFERKAPRDNLGLGPPTPLEGGTVGPRVRT